MAERFVTTLCYVERDGCVLLMHRNKEPNLGLWTAPGGKLEFDESPHECALRELHEETGLRGRQPQLRGIITETSTRLDEQWVMFVFVVRQVEGEVPDSLPANCKEGTLAWVPIEQVLHLPIPGSDAIFFPHVIGDGPLFCARFVFDPEQGVVGWEQYEG